MDNIGIGMRIWLESEQGFTFGPGQAELLKNIKNLGSLSKAAEHMGMSYRRAWGRLKKLESSVDKPLVDKSAGNKAGFTLTPYAEEMIRSYEAWEASVFLFADTKARELFPNEMHPSSQAGNQAI